MKRMILLLLSATLAARSLDAAAQGYTGCIPLSRGEYANLPIAPLPSHTRSATPSSCFLKTPAVGNQGTQGSCVAWATAYAATGILATTKNGEETRLSPAFVFNQLQRWYLANIPEWDPQNGSYVIDGLKLLTNQGACLLNEMKYTQSDFSRQPTAEMHWSALSNRIKWGRHTNDTDVNEYRFQLASGHPVVISIHCTDNFYSEGGTNGFWCHYGKRTHKKDGHALCVVGYDDNKTYGGKTGFLKVMNSWGDSWGDNGFLWIAYDLVKTVTILEAYAVYDISPNVRLEGDGVLCSSGGTYHIENGAPEWGVHWEAGSKAQIVRQSGFAAEAKSVRNERHERDGYESIAARVSVPGEWPCEALGSKRVWTGVPTITICSYPPCEEGEHADMQCGGHASLRLSTPEMAGMGNTALCSIEHGGNLWLNANSNPEVASAVLYGTEFIAYAKSPGGTVFSVASRNECGIATGTISVRVEKKKHGMHPPGKFDLQLLGARR